MNDDFCELIKKCIELLSKQDFKREIALCVFDIPETKNETFIEAEKSAIRKGSFRFWISVGRTSSDYYARNCMTSDKIKERFNKYNALSSSYIYFFYILLYTTAFLFSSSATTTANIILRSSES